MEGDLNCNHCPDHGHISIHSLRMEGDLVLFHFLYLAFSFQSTPSAWRETGRNPALQGCSTRNFNPLPPHGGRPERSRLYPCREYISIHSLRMEGDQPILHGIGRFRYFNPRPPHGGRRGRQTETVRREGISIHSLRMEGDREKRLCHHSPQPFQSTPSAWRETWQRC